MSLLELVDERAISTHLESLEKEDVIKELIELLIKSGKIKEENKGKAIEDVLAREKKGSTGLEKGVAVPHAKTEAVSELSMAIGISKEGVDFNSIDGEYSYIFFMLLAPPGSSGPHVEALSQIARFMTPAGVREKLKNANTPEDVIKVIADYENNV